MQHSLSSRQAKVFEIVVRGYVDTAEPIGSAYVCKALKDAVSPATVRNEMVVLERLGLLLSPHTSAGRVPSEEGYRYYIKNFIAPGKLPKQEEKELQSVWQRSSSSEECLKKTAKLVAMFASEGVFLAFGRNNVYYTGLTNLFQQPEFASPVHVQQMIMVIDHLDEVVRSVFDDIENEVQVRVGSDNPFGADCSVVMTRYRIGKEDEQGIFGILGPIRMDYRTNVARVNFVQDGLKQTT